VPGDEAANWPRLIESKRIESKRCDLCDRAGTDIDTCYIRLTRFSVGIGRVSERWANILCSRCRSCYRKGRHITLVRVFAAMFMFGPMFLGFAVALLTAQNIGPSERIPDAVMRLFCFGFLFSFFSIYVTPFIVGTLIRRRIKRLLDPHLDAQLRYRWTYTGQPLAA
jgi:hypothetical protein